MKLLQEIRFLTVSTLVFVLLGMIGTSYLYFYHDEPNHFGNATSDSLVANEKPPVMTEEMQAGKLLYTQHCSRCHHLSDQKLIGPGLSGVMNRINEDQFMIWVNNPEGTRKTDPYFEKLFIEYDEYPMTDFNLTDVELKLLMNYIVESDK